MVNTGLMRNGTAARCSSFLQGLENLGRSRRYKGPLLKAAEIASHGRFNFSLTATGHEFLRGQALPETRNMTAFSLQEAAEQTGTSRADVWRAIQAGSLPAERLPGGGFAIDPVELFRVFERPALLLQTSPEGVTLEKETGARLPSASALGVSPRPEAGSAEPAAGAGSGARRPDPEGAAAPEPPRRTKLQSPSPPLRSS